jgi:hypothetical protein
MTSILDLKWLYYCPQTPEAAINGLKIMFPEDSDSSFSVKKLFYGRRILLKSLVLGIIRGESLHRLFKTCSDLFDVNCTRTGEKSNSTQWQTLQLNRLRWIPILQADYVSHELDASSLDEWDAFILPPINRAPIHRALELRKKVGDRLILGEIEAFDYLPIKEKWKQVKNRIQPSVDAVDLIPFENRYFINSGFFNTLFETDKFVFLNIANFDVDYVKKFYKERKEKTRYVIAPQQSFNSSDSFHAVKVMRAIHKKGYNWRGTITGAQSDFPFSRRQVYPFQLAQYLPWQEYLDFVASSYLGIFHSKGIASCAVLGACVGTPFLGTQFAEGIVNCFPELVVEWGNYEKMAELAIRLIKEPAWYDEVVSKAEERVDKIYSFREIRKQLNIILKERDLL